MEKPQPHGRTFDVEQSMRIVKDNALAQSHETRENYFKSCEAKGPEMAAIVAEVRKGWFEVVPGIYQRAGWRA